MKKPKKRPICKTSEELAKAITTIVMPSGSGEPVWTIELENHSHIRGDPTGVEVADDEVLLLVRDTRRMKTKVTRSGRLHLTCAFRGALCPLEELPPHFSAHMRMGGLAPLEPTRDPEVMRKQLLDTADRMNVMFVENVRRGVMALLTE